MSKKIILIAGLLACVLGCTKTNQSIPTTSPRVLNLAIWSNYVTPEILADFEKRTGIKVQISNYSSNEELLAKLQAGASGYDVAVPSDYMVFAMSKLGLVLELNSTKLSNLKSLDPRFLKKPYDPTNRYSVPYDWGTTGIAVNRDLYKGKMNGWKDLFNATNLSGKFSLLDDVRETVGASLKMLGLSLNTTRPEDLKRAKEVLLKARSRVKAFTSEPMMPLMSGETAVAHAYMSDTLQARHKSGGKNIEYIIPEEGATLWIDNLVIPRGAAHIDEAHLFINYLLEAKTNASTVMNIFVAPANKDTLALLPKEYQLNSALFPSPKVLEPCEMMQDLGEATTLWDRVWTEVKADQG